MSIIFSKKFNAVFVGSCTLLKSFAYKKHMDTWIREQKNYSSDEIEVISKEEYLRRGDLDVNVFNLLTGKPVTIKARDRGGVCDPSKEAYHSF